jgi:hypothetical protein
MEPKKIKIYFFLSGLRLVREEPGGLVHAALVCPPVSHYPLPCTLHAQLRYPPPPLRLLSRGEGICWWGPGISRWERKAPSCTCPLSVADCMSMYTFPPLDLVLHLLFLLLFDPPPEIRNSIPRTKDKKRDIHTRGIQGIGARYRYTCPCRQTLGTRQRGTPDLFPVSSQILRSKPYPCLGLAWLS